MNVVVNGLMVNYQKYGQGKTIVLIHGWGDSSRTFSAVVEKLQQNYKVLAVDLPGFGGSQTPPNSWGTLDYAKFIAAWLKKIDEPNPYAVIAHSFGGAVSIVAVGQKIIMPKNLVLIAASGVRDINKGQKTVLKLITKAGKPALMVLPSSSSSKLKRKFYKSIGSDKMLIKHMDEIYSRIITEDVQDDAKLIKIPTLLIYAEKDTSSPPAYGKLLSNAVQGSRLAVVPLAGHFVHQEKPLVVGNLISDFLNE